jgi:hypothetical protein
MTIPSSGPISLLTIQNEFGGGAPIGLNEYYRNGALVTGNDYAPNVPTSGQITLSSFYGAKKNTFNTVTYSSPGSYSFVIPSTLQGPITITLLVGAGGGGGGSRFQGDGRGSSNGGSGGYYQNVTVSASGGQTILIGVGQGGHGSPPYTEANGGTGGSSSFHIPGVYYIDAGGGGGGDGVAGDNSPQYGGFGGGPNGASGSYTAYWMTNRNTQGYGFDGQGQNGTGYGNGGLGGNSNGPVFEGSAGADGIVQFQGWW